VVLPLQVLAVNGPFFLMAVALLLAGLREEGRALRGELEAEAAAGRGTIEAHEVLTLASPLRRLEARLLALSQGGFSDYQWVGRLQATQLDLATERWHRAQRRLVDPLEAEGHLRQRALILKHGRPAPYVSHPRR
jgi:hypothetical protein